MAQTPSQNQPAPAPSGMRGGVNIPQPNASSGSKRPMYILIGVVMTLLLVFAIAIMNTGIKSSTKKDDSSSMSSPRRLNAGAASGVNIPEQKMEPILLDQPKPQAPEKKPEPKKPEVEKKSPEELRAEQLHKEKMAAFLRAVNSPMSKGGGGRKVSDESGGGQADSRKADRMDQYISALSKMNQQRTPADEYAIEQKDKEAFFDRASQRANKKWLLDDIRRAGWEYELKTGTVIPGVMITGINTDLPGVIMAQVSQNVYNTSNGKHLLIPQGSRLYGMYDSRVNYGQRRVLIAWQRVIFPDGSSITLGAMPGVDIGGYAGFHDKVDNHYIRIFGTAFLLSAIVGGQAYALDKLDKDKSDEVTYQEEVGTELTREWGQIAQEMTRKNLNVSPTLEIRPGFEFRLLVVKDIAFTGPYVPFKKYED